MLKNFQNNYSKVGHVLIDKNNKQFKLKNIVIPGKNKKGSLFNKAAIAAMTAGLSLLVQNGAGKKNTDWINFEDLISYELIKNDDIVVSGGTGKAILGGTVVTMLVNPLLGAAGAIAGGITGKRTTSKKINSLAVRITINKFDLTCCFIYLIEKSTKSNSKDYKKAVEEAQQLLSTLDLIAHNQ